MKGWAWLPDYLKQEPEPKQETKKVKKTKYKKLKAKLDALKAQVEQWETTTGATHQHNKNRIKVLEQRCVGYDNVIRRLDAKVKALDANEALRLAGMQPLRAVDLPTVNAALQAAAAGTRPDNDKQVNQSTNHTPAGQ